MTPDKIAKYAYLKTVAPEKTFVIYNGYEIVGHFDKNHIGSDINMKENKWVFMKILPEPGETTLHGSKISKIEIRKP